jgi:hypothetical protein
MTISGRNRIYGACAAVELAMLAICVLSILAFTLAQKGKLPTSTAQPFFAWDPQFFSLRNPLLHNEIVSAFLAGASFIFGIWLMRLFRKDNSPEMLFLAVFVCSLSFEALRSVLGWVTARGEAPLLGALLSRVVFCARWTGLFSLFLASLYASGFGYENVGRVIGFALFLSALVASMIPLTTDMPTVVGLYRPGFFSVCLVVWLAFSALIGVDYFFGAIADNSTDHMKIGLALIGVMAGRDGLFWFRNGLVCALGGILFVLSLLSIIRVSFRRSLWQ